LVQRLSRAVELYRDPLLPDVAWHWVEALRADFRARFVMAALQLSDVLARRDPERSDALAERALAVAPDSDVAYERLIHNARARSDAAGLRRAVRRYQDAATHFGFTANPVLLNASGR
jgi:two-component SAPR family response regulator